MKLLKDNKVWIVSIYEDYNEIVGIFTSKEKAIKNILQEMKYHYSDNLTDEEIENNWNNYYNLFHITVQ